MTLPQPLKVSLYPLPPSVLSTIPLFSTIPLNRVVSFLNVPLLIIPAWTISFTQYSSIKYDILAKFAKVFPFFFDTSSSTYRPNTTHWCRIREDAYPDPKGKKNQTTTTTTKPYNHSQRLLFQLARTDAYNLAYHPSFSQRANQGILRLITQGASFSQWRPFLFMESLLIILLNSTSPHQACIPLDIYLSVEITTFSPWGKSGQNLPGATSCL